MSVSQLETVKAGGGDIGRLPSGLTGFLAYTLGIGAMVFAVERCTLQPVAVELAAIIGVLAIWRYSWGLVHFCRSHIYRNTVFPALRAQVEEAGDSLMPSHVYLLVTSFRIEAETSLKVYRAAVQEAIRCGIPATIVASIVELGDEFLVGEVFRAANPPPHVRLIFVRIPGTGKRDALGQGFRAISRDIPAPDAVVAVIDGDSELGDGLIRKCAPFFCLMPDLGALTTDEDCDVEGSKVMTEWHRLRFAQRHILMSSMSLSCKVLTLTGRMSMFRADVVTDAAFIRHVENDSVGHWRLGHIKFLTGDDKSTWYWTLRRGYSMLYVPDVCVNTVEHPPSDSFFKATTILMMRWFGNMLRTNGRALALGPARTGLFAWWCVLDQRVSMWTSLTGPVFAVFLGVKHSWTFVLLYLTWIGITRWIMTLMLLSARPALSWRYPFLMYYNQIWGSCIKTYAFFRLDRQSWTRQKTSIDRGLSWSQLALQRGSSLMLHGVAMMTFITIVGLLAGVLQLPAF
ncbi:MAG: glycosyltransferase family 2 protein [Alphaproteobacteria bacterium]